MNRRENRQMESKYRLLFEKIAGKDDQIDAFQLKEILEAAFSKGDILSQRFYLIDARDQS